MTERNYEDIINLPNYRSKTRPAMPLGDRAAQFAPFAALSGHAALIRETARLTDRKIQLSEDLKNDLARKLRTIQELLPQKPAISVTYFVPDEKKQGGQYQTITGTVKKIDTFQQLMIMEDGTVIPLQEIVALGD